MGVLATVAKTALNKGGRPTEEYYLNRRQAIFITVKSETEQATDELVGQRHSFPEPLSETVFCLLAIDRLAALKCDPIAGMARIAIWGVLAESQRCCRKASRSTNHAPGRTPSNCTRRDIRISVSIRGIMAICQMKSPPLLAKCYVTSASRASSGSRL
jgi:hypothetical protein